MIPYIVTFLMSAVFMYMAEQMTGTDSGSRAIKKIFVSIGLILPCLLAGLRNPGIGMDSGGWAVDVYNAAALNSNFQQFSEAAAKYVDSGLAFRIVTFVTVRITYSISALFFVIELLILVPTYMSIRNFSSGHHTWIAMLGYYFEFYCLGLSGMRQFIAMSFFIYSISLLWSGKKTLSLVWIVTAILFHTSAVIGLAYYLIWLILLKQEGSRYVFKKGWRFVTLIVVVFYFAVLLLSDVAVQWLVENIPIFAHYSGYTSRSHGSNYISFYLFVGSLLATCTLLYWGNRARDCRTLVLILMIVSAFILYSLQSIDTDFTRTAWYAWYLIIPLFAVLVSQARGLFSLPILLFMLITITNFYWYYVINGYYACVPYSSVLLGC